MRWLTTLTHDDTGQDMVEYGLLSAMISIVAVVTLKSIGPLVAILYMIKRRIAIAG